MIGKFFVFVLVLCIMFVCVAYGTSDAICQNQHGSFHANPDDCSQYFQCVNGTAVLKQCEGDYLWKDENKWCDYPYNVDCGDRHNPHPPPQSVCTGLDGVLLADEQDCSKFYQCANGYAVHKKCPGNHLWNDIMKWCDYPENVHCNVGGKRGFRDEPYPTSCPAIDGPDDVLLPNPDDCSTFFKCYKGKPVLHLCPPGLLWNDDMKYCDYPQNVECDATSDEVA